MANHLNDDPDRDVAYHCLTKKKFSLGNAINKPLCWSHAKARVNGMSIM